MAQIIKIGKNYYSDFRQDGKRIRRMLSPYKEQAEEMLKDLLQLQDPSTNGTHPQDISWFLFREKYLKHCRENKALQSYYLDKHALDRIEKHGRPLTRLSQMNPDYLADFWSKWKEKGFNPKTGIAHMRRMKTAMHWATAWKMAPLHNWKLIPTPPDAGRIAHMDPGMFAKVLAACKGHWKTAAMLMGYAGTRSSETRWLEWKDVDFKNHWIHIRAKLGFKPKGTKPNKCKDRIIDMPKTLEDYLQSIPERSGYVLGMMIKPHTYRLHFRRLSDKVGFKVYAHMFRHSYASFLISSGSTLPEVGSLLGHSDARSTEIYTHMLPRARKNAVDRLERSLQEPAQV